jgi:calcineurin-like phosphoesterase family protein
MARIFAIGDIHGCNKTFRKLLIEKIRISVSDEIYCVGDYIDRGNDSKGVIDFILELRKENYRIHTIRGNHEQMLLASAGGSQHFRHWILNGGNTTLRSFGVDSVHELDTAYLDFFRSTRFYIETEKCIFVHAGLNFSLPDPFADKEAMLWIRNFPVQREKLNGKILIHGHTPVSLSFILSQVNKEVINIDGGCVHNHVEEFGNLVAFDINEKKIISVRNID